MDFLSVWVQGGSLSEAGSRYCNYTALWVIPLSSNTFMLTEILEEDALSIIDHVSIYQNLLCLFLRRYFM